jgi:hypothetical protein
LSATSQIMVLLFPMINSFTWSTFSSVLLIGGRNSIHLQQRSHCFWTRKTTQKLVVERKIWCRHGPLSSLPFSVCGEIPNGARHTCT